MSVYSNSGHIDLTLRKYDRAYVDLTKDFVVGSCGQTFIKGGSVGHSTLRENGRGDYQILYLSKGEYIFDFNGVQKKLLPGMIAVYRPSEAQKYSMIGDNDTEIFWTHFTGYDCERILKELGFFESGVYTVGNNEKFFILYKWIIKELQLKRDNYIEIATGYFKQLLFLMSRSYIAGAEQNSETHFAEAAMLYFYRNFNQDISIDEYALSQNITACWLRRCFKKHTGVSPQQFINDIRLSYARELLLTTDLKIAEISERCGYENPFYFSRIFAKSIGCSPIQFKKNNSSK